MRVYFVSQMIVLPLLHFHECAVLKNMVTVLHVDLVVMLVVVVFSLLQTGDKEAKKIMIAMYLASLKVSSV